MCPICGKRVSGGVGDTARVSRFGDVYENRVTGERAVVLRGEKAGPGEPALVHLTVKPGGAVPGEHFHPHVQERFRVVSGTLGTRVHGVERTPSAGEEATVRAATRACTRSTCNPTAAPPRIRTSSR